MNIPIPSACRALPDISFAQTARRILASAVATALAAPAAGHAQSTDAILPVVEVRTERSIADKNQLPATTESITASRIADTVNAVTVEDALKYLPNILIRKRYAGDTQAPMATRTTGINASARSLIYVDGLLLSTLVNNNNANGSPQWFMVAPQEIGRIDVMYGPFSAAYPGNSFGAVTEITTRMPTRFEGSARISSSASDFRQYGTDATFRARQAGAVLGSRSGDWAWRISANHLESDSQPLTYLTVNRSDVAAAGSLPAVSGAFEDRNRTGGPIAVVGAGNLAHTEQDNATLKLVYDLSATASASYTLGYWQNRADAGSQSYLTTATGAPYYGGTGSVSLGGSATSAATIGTLFSSNRVEQEHRIQSVGLKSSIGGSLRWEILASQVDFMKDLTRTSTDPYPAARTGGAGRIADAGGTGWRTVDAKVFYRPSGWAQHAVSAGAHYDRYQLSNPTYVTADWVGGAAGVGSAFSDARGKTRTGALWAQDVWQLSPAVVATLGLRHESWRAYDGFNFSTGANGRGFPVDQPTVTRDGFSPKASLAWQVDPVWSLSASLGRALRFPTVGELFQSVQTGTTFTQANPFLQPERVLAGELAIERSIAGGKVRVSLFDEHVSDALIGQTANLPGSALPVSFVQNIERTHQRGIELVMQQRDALVKGLELSGNLTYVDARITANGSYVATVPGSTSVGQRTPYVPAWRASMVASYRPDDRWTYALAARASSRLFATVDNTDVNAATYQGFEGFFVADARVRYQIDRRWSAALGIDNLNDRAYYLFHPFPQRSVTAELKFDY